MAHEVTMEARISQVLHRDVEFVAKKDSAKLGTLKISKGGIEWVPVGNSVNTIKKNWSQFSALMASQQ